MYLFGENKILCIRLFWKIGILLRMSRLVEGDATLTHFYKKILETVPYCHFEIKKYQFNAKNTLVPIQEHQIL